MPELSIACRMSASPPPRPGGQTSRQPLVPQVSIPLVAATEDLRRSVRTVVRPAGFVTDTSEVDGLIYHCLIGILSTVDGVVGQFIIVKSIATGALTPVRTAETVVQE